MGSGVSVKYSQEEITQYVQEQICESTMEQLRAKFLDMPQETRDKLTGAMKEFATSAQNGVVQPDGEEREEREDEEPMVRQESTYKSVSIAMEFPMYVMSMATFLEQKEMRPHLVLLAEELIAPWTAKHGPVNLLSHQWLAFSHPDPAGDQLRAMQEVFRIIIGGELPFRSEQDWELYCKSRDYKDSVGDLDVELISKSAFVASVEKGCIWLDYAGVPQVGVRENAVEIDEKFKDMQQKAVNAIPAYVEASTNLWVMVPPCQHVDLKVECNFTTWKKRGWCRTEDWSNEFSICSHRPLIVESPRDIWVEDFAVKMTSRAQRPFSALNGDFTCCRLGHTANGQDFPCDKPRVREVVRTTLDNKIAYLLESKDWLHYAWFLMLRPALLAETLSEDDPLDIPDEDLDAFLRRFGFREDVEGKDTPEHFVFFPLFCAATEGNVRITKSLLEAKADVKRRLLGQGTGALEAASLSGHLGVCKCLLAHRADLHDAAPLDGRTALDKAAEGGASGVLQLLLGLRADVATQTKELRTPLMGAALGGHKECVRLLLEGGADTTALDSAGMTASALASSTRQWEVLENPALLSSSPPSS